MRGNDASPADEASLRRLYDGHCWSSPGDSDVLGDRPLLAVLSESQAQEYDKNMGVNQVGKKN